MYAALHYRNGEIPNESVIKATIDYRSYKSVQEKALPKFKYYAQCMAELRKTLDEDKYYKISMATFTNAQNSQNPNSKIEIKEVKL